MNSLQMSITTSVHYILQLHEWNTARHELHLHNSHRSTLHCSERRCCLAVNKTLATTTPQRYFFWRSTRYYTIFGFLIRLSHDICDILWLMIGAKFVPKKVRNAWYAWVIHTMVHVEYIKCIKVAKYMPIHAKGMSLQMQRVKWS